MTATLQDLLDDPRHVDMIIEGLLAVSYRYKRALTPQLHTDARVLFFLAAGECRRYQSLAIALRHATHSTIAATGPEGAPDSPAP